MEPVPERSGAGHLCPERFVNTHYQCHRLTTSSRQPCSQTAVHLLSHDGHQKATWLGKAWSDSAAPRVTAPHRPHPLAEVLVQSHTQKVKGVFGRAVGLPAPAVLEVLQAEVRPPRIARRRPDEPRRAVTVSEERFQLLNLNEK